MPFDSRSGAAAGRKSSGKRWAGKDPSTVRNKQLLINISTLEAEMIADTVVLSNVSRTEMIVRAVSEYREGLIADKSKGI